MTRYHIGADFERRVRRHLESQGWVVFRSSGSRGPCDLIALRMGEVMLVQCRINGRLTPVERENLKLVARELGCQVALASRQNHTLRWETL